MAFQDLKHVVTNPLVLVLLDFFIPFAIQCDAFGIGVGIVLMQQGKPLALYESSNSWNGLATIYL